MTFSNRLRALIDERNITQKELAKQLCIPVSTLGGYVQGTSEPDFQTLKMLASYFDTSTDYLLGYEKEMPVSEREDDLLRIFRSLRPEQKDIYLEQGAAFLRYNYDK